MQLENTYYWYKSALTDEQCDHIINLGLSKLENNKQKGIQTQATTMGNRSIQDLPDGIPQLDKSLVDFSENKDKTFIRDSEVSWLNDKYIYDIIFPLMYEANEKSKWFYDIDLCETCQFTKYGLNQFYGWHADGGSDHSWTLKRYLPGITPLVNGNLPKHHTRVPGEVGKVRKISMTINLCDENDYDGGLLKFDYGPHSEKERYKECVEIKPRGSVIFFPSYVYHQVTPVTRGTRYSLVAWFLGEPFR